MRIKQHIQTEIENVEMCIRDSLYCRWWLFCRYTVLFCSQRYWWVFLENMGLWCRRLQDVYKRQTWHCGDGKNKYGITNANSLGIEICINSCLLYTSKDMIEEIKPAHLAVEYIFTYRLWQDVKTELADWSQVPVSYTHLCCICGI